MKKYMTGYCWDCCEDTKQEVIECEDSNATKIFEAVFTLGFSSIIPRNYNCECLRCGCINTISK